MSKEITEPPTSVTNRKEQGVLCSKDLLAVLAKELRTEADFLRVANARWPGKPVTETEAIIMDSIARAVERTVESTANDQAEP